MDINGAPDTLECLHRPADCIPGYAGPRFLDERFLEPTSYGFLWEFYPGPPAPLEFTTSWGASPSSMESFAFVSIPIATGAGYRSHCVDVNGAICGTAGRGRPPVSGGRCVVTAGPPPKRSWWSRGSRGDAATVEPCYDVGWN
jgi:hypothetical protein